MLQVVAVNEDFDIEEECLQSRSCWSRACSHECATGWEATVDILAKNVALMSRFETNWTAEFSWYLDDTLRAVGDVMFLFLFLYLGVHWTSFFKSGYAY